MRDRDARVVAACSRSRWPRRDGCGGPRDESWLRPPIWVSGAASPGALGALTVGPCHGGGARRARAARSSRWDVLGSSSTRRSRLDHAVADGRSATACHTRRVRNASVPRGPGPAAGIPRSYLNHARSVAARQGYSRQDGNLGSECRSVGLYGLLFSSARVFQSRRCAEWLGGSPVVSRASP